MNEIKQITLESEDSEKELRSAEVKLQFHWYLLGFFITFLGSYIIPAFIIMGYVVFIYIPYVLNVKLIFSIFTSIYSFLATLFMPFIIIVCYVIHVIMMGVLTRWLWDITEKSSPTKSGIIPRNIGSKTLNFYHIRSFLLKYPKNAIIKGPFPWLINWFYNFVGSNVIGKGTTIEEQFGADRFIETGENCYLGVNSGYSSHSVEGIFGNIAYYKITLGDNVTTSGLNCLAPGVKIKDNSWLLPMAGATKFSTLKGNNFYFGIPLRKIFKRKIAEYLNLSEEEIEKVNKVEN